MQVKKSIISLTVAAVVAAGSSWVIMPMFAADESNMPHPATDALQANQALILPVGITEKQLNVDSALRTTLASVTESGLAKKNAVYDVAGYLVNADRDRIRAEIKNINMDDLNNRATELSNAYKNKYGQPLSMDGAKVFTDRFIEIKTGEVSDPDMLSGHWPVAQLLGSTADRPADQSGLTQGASVPENDKFFGGKTKLDKGRNVAIVRIGMGHGLPQLTLSFIHELPASWRLDIPDTISGQVLHDRLLDTVSYLNTHQELWPADVYEADRMISHAVLGAVYGQVINPADAKTASER